MKSNHDLEKECEYTFYVIEAERDGIRKYVSREFPHTFPYTVMLQKARRFGSAKIAQRFVDDFNETNRYPIKNARIVPVRMRYRVEEGKSE